MLWLISVQYTVFVMVVSFQRSSSGHQKPARAAGPKDRFQGPSTCPGPSPEETSVKEGNIKNEL